MKDKVTAALNAQINKEFFSEYLYLAMSADMDAKGFRGLAQWLKAQADEEHTHGDKIYKFILDCSAKVKLTAMAEPQQSWKSPLDAFEAAYKHEQMITASIYDIVALAEAEKDLATVNFLQWFVAEQVEEERQTAEIVQSLQMAGASIGGVFALDHHLGKRGK
jgi:ferritin